MKLSACWITKNEKANIARSIGSVKGLVDEMIVTDTGSTDGTVEIARSLGATVVEFEWVNDFAAARNFGLQYATGDVVLMLDADEWYEPALSEKDRTGVEALFSDGKTNVLMILRDNIDPDTELTIAVDYMPRAFLNRDGFHFENAIHEVPAFAAPVPARTRTTDALRIVHNGYGKEVSKAKYLRNYEILNEEAEKSPDNAYKALNLSYIVREAAGMGQPERALEALNWLLLHPKLENEVFDGRGYLMATVLYRGFMLAGKNPLDVRADLVAGAWVDHVPRQYPKAPISHLVKPFYEGFILRDERYLFAHLDSDVAAGNRVLGLVDTEDADLFRRGCAFLYDRAARACMARGRVPQAFDFVTKALRVDPKALLSDSLPVFFQCVKGLPWQDVVSFVNQTLDITKLGNLDMLFSALRYEGGADMYIYYCKRALDLGKAKKGDFWYLLIMLGKYREAAEAAFESRADSDVQTVSQLIFLAAVCAEDKSIAQAFGEALHDDDRRALDVIWNGEKPEVATCAVLVENYAFIAFAKGRAYANRLAGLFPDEGAGEARYRVMLEYYRNSALYKEFFEEITPLADIADADLSESLIGMQLLAGEYAGALERVMGHARRLRMDRAVFAALDVVEDAADAATSGRARAFTAVYRPAFEKWASCAATVSANIPIPADAAPARARLAAMGEVELGEKLERPGMEPFAGMAWPVLAHMDAALAAKAYYAVLEDCAFLLGDEDAAPLAHEALAAVFAGVKNEALAARMKRDLANGTDRLEKRLDALLAEIGQMDSEDGDVSGIVPRDRVRDFRALAERMGGYESKQVLYGVLAAVAMNDAESLQTVIRPAKLAYWYPSLVPLPKNSLLVDGAAEDGGAARFLLDRYGGGTIDHVVCFVEDDEQARLCERALKYVPNARVVRAAPAADGENALDAAVDAPLALLKLDATGALTALAGAHSHIASDHPAVMVEIGCDLRALLDIPAEIDRICPGYRYDLRYHGECSQGDMNVPASGIVLAAVYVGT